MLQKTPDGNQIAAWRQGGQGNCSTVAAIKGLVDAYGKEGAFTSINKNDDGSYNVKLLDGRDVALTTKELAHSTKRSGFIEKGEGNDLEFANLAFAVAAKNKQNLSGYNSFDHAINSLNDGENPWDSPKWLGVPKENLINMSGKDASKYDSMVGWNSRHAVFVDRHVNAEGQASQKVDLYGNANHFGGGGGVSYRRGLFGRRIPVRSAGYSAGFAFKPLPSE